MAETTHDVVRMVYPGASDEECGHLLWNSTGYPSFWRTGNPRRDILNSLRALRRAERRGHPICELCQSKAVFPPSKRMHCAGCSHAFGERGQARLRRKEANEQAAGERMGRANG